MALKLYNPKTQAFAAITLPVNDLPLSELLLLNLLIESQVQSEYLKSILGAVRTGNSGSTQEDEIETIRVDIVSAN